MVFDVDITDHLPNFCIFDDYLKKQNIKTDIVKFRNFSFENKTKFYNILNDVKSDVILNDININENVFCLLFFYSLTLKNVSQFVRSKSVQKN